MSVRRTRTDRSTPLIERGQAEAERFERAEASRHERDRDDNYSRTLFHFRLSFGSPGVPEQLDVWEPIDDDLRAASTFSVDGIRFVCRWRFEGAGGDRAYWDDGWWPEWYVSVPLRLRGWRFWRDEVRVHGPANVAELFA